MIYQKYMVYFFLIFPNYLRLLPGKNSRNLGKKPINTAEFHIKKAGTKFGLKNDLLNQFTKR